MACFWRLVLNLLEVAVKFICPDSSSVIGILSLPLQPGIFLKLEVFLRYIYPWKSDEVLGYLQIHLGTQSFLLWSLISPWTDEGWDAAMGYSLLFWRLCLIYSFLSILIKKTKQNKKTCLQAWNEFSNKTNAKYFLWGGKTGYAFSCFSHTTSVYLTNFKI